MDSRFSDKKKGSLFRAVVLFFLGLLLNGCATLLTGMKQSIKVDSEPPSAKVYVDSTLRGKTPMYLQLEKQMGGTKIRMHSQAFGTKTFRADVGFNSMTIGNLGNPIGWGVDLLTGSFFEYKERYYKLELKKDSSRKTEEEKEADYYEPDPKKRGSGQGAKVEVQRSEHVPIDKKAPKKKFLGFSYRLLSGGFAREIGGQVMYKPFRRVGFELGGGYHIKSPYLVQDLVDQNRNPNVGGKGYSLRATFDFYPLGGLEYREKKMDRWGFELGWRQFTTGKFWVQSSQQPSLQEQSRDKVGRLRLTISRGASWSGNISGKSGWVLETRLGVGMQSNEVQRKKFKRREFKGSPVHSYSQPKSNVERLIAPTLELDIRLGIGTLYGEGESPFGASP